LSTSPLRGADRYVTANCQAPNSRSWYPRSHPAPCSLADWCRDGSAVARAPQLRYALAPSPSFRFVSAMLLVAALRVTTSCQSPTQCSRLTERRCRCLFPGVGSHGGEGRGCNGPQPPIARPPSVSTCHDDRSCRVPCLTMLRMACIFCARCAVVAPSRACRNDCAQV
jgi:hypothetical protein